MQNKPTDIESLAQQLESIIIALDNAGHALAAAYADTGLQFLRDDSSPVTDRELELPVI